VVGLTGGLASGKSTIAKILADRGVPIFDADAAVHGLYRAGGEGAAAVAELFGREMVDTMSGVDREALAARVLGNDRARLQLEAAIHPLVRRQVSEWLESLHNEPVAVVEAALLVETGSYRDYDVLMVAWCQPKQQLERAVTRGLPAERARGLINAQLPLDEKKEVADVVVDNRGNLEDLAQEVDRAWTQILRLCAAGKLHGEGADRRLVGGNPPTAAE
jgi:dephospho-CoA kinase